MKKVYIAHPLRGGTRDVRVIAQNVEAISGICQALAEIEPEPEEERGLCLAHKNTSSPGAR